MIRFGGARRPISIAVRGAIARMGEMAANQRNGRESAPILRAFVEIGFIIFLFYSNLLMGEFTHANGRGKTLAFAIHDIFTVANFEIAVVAAAIGYVVVEFLRRKL